MHHLFTPVLYIYVYKVWASVWCYSLYSNIVTAYKRAFIIVLSFIDRESCIPVPPAGHHWKEIRHDNSVTWLASWTENIQGSIKYIMLNANSKLKVQAKSAMTYVSQTYLTIHKQFRGNYIFHFI